MWVFERGQLIKLPRKKLNKNPPANSINFDLLFKEKKKNFDLTVKQIKQVS